MSKGVLFSPLAQDWYCPNCGKEERTFLRVLPGTAMTHFHDCSSLKNFSAPMVPAGIKAKVVSHEREDYLGSDIPQVDDDGRPIMSVTTTRDDGEDCVVYAPTTIARIS